MTTKSHFIRLKFAVATVLLVMMCVPTFSGEALAQSAEPYAVLSTDGTLTFSYGEKPEGSYGMDYVDNRGTMLPQWNAQADKIKKVVFDKSFSQARPTDCSYWFWKATKLQSIEDIHNLCTDQVTNMRYMFAGCDSVNAIDVSNFNTQNVTSLSYMFYNCGSLTSLDLSGFNTQNVTDMSSMFRLCRALTSLNVSGFNTEKVTTMSSMFSRCSALKSLDVSGFNTQNVENMVDMFYSCLSLTSLDLKNFNTQKVTEMSYMFSDCSQLTTLDLSSFNTQNVERMSHMFNSCYKLTSVNLSSFNTQKVTEMSYMFRNCYELPTLDLSSFNTRKVTNMSYMFSYCTSLESLDLLNFNTESVSDMSNMFCGCSKLTALDLSGFNTRKVMDMSNMFCGCSKLTALDLSGFNTQKVIDMSYMFDSCKKLSTIYVGGNFDVAAVRSSSDMFSKCSALKGASAFAEGNVTHEYANYTKGYLTRLAGKIGDARIGAVGETLTTDSLKIADGQDFVAYLPFHAATARYTREVTDVKWGTLCLPFAIAQNEEECEFYSFKSINDRNATVEVESFPAGTVIPAGTPVIFKMHDGHTALDVKADDVDVVQKPVADTESIAALVGTFTKIDGEAADTVLTDKVYVYGADKFFRPTLIDCPQVHAMGAYIKGTGNESSLTLDFAIVSGPTTSVADVAVEPADAAHTAIFDVQGRRTAGMQKGINIVKIGSKAYKVMVR